MRNDQIKVWNKVVAMAWADGDFKDRLTSNPKEVLNEHGASMPESATVRIEEVAENEIVLALPPKPKSAGADLSEAVEERLQAQFI